MNSCSICGKSTNSERRTTCSYECRYEALRRKMSQKRQTVCEQCGKTFEQSPSRDYKYCSHECLKIAGIAKRTVVCKECNKPFLRHRGRYDQQFCSHSCAGRANRQKRSLYEPEPIANCRWIALNKLKFALVNETDYDEIALYTWRYDNHKYPATKINGKTVRMHTFLMKRVWIDHKNGDTLDNRRENLRPVNRAQNKANSRLAKNNTSGYKGVCKDHNKWRAKIHGEYLGLFETAEEAAKAYDAEAQKIYGEYAKLNFV